MTALVINTSAAIEIARDATGEASSPWHPEFYAPELIDLEFASVLRRLVRRGELVADIANGYVADWMTNSLTRCGHTPLLPRIWQMRDELTIYDASFVALAETLRVPLVTSDRKLARTAGRYCEVILIGRG